MLLLIPSYTKCKTNVGEFCNYHVAFLILAQNKLNAAWVAIAIT